MITLKARTLTNVIEHESFFQVFNGTFSDETEQTCLNISFEFTNNETEEEVTVTLDSFLPSVYDDPYELQVNVGEYIQTFMALATEEKRHEMTIGNFVEWFLENFIDNAIKCVITTSTGSQSVYVYTDFSYCTGSAIINDLTNLYTLGYVEEDVHEEVVGNIESLFKETQYIVCSVNEAEEKIQTVSLASLFKSLGV